MSVVNTVLECKMCNSSKRSILNVQAGARLSLVRYTDLIFVDNDMLRPYDSPLSFENIGNLF
jgi:hypothetical protein